jgi:Secretion system C-terminal sorting domain
MKKILLSLLIIVIARVSFAQPAKDLQTPCASTSQGTIGGTTISYTIGEMVLVESYKKNGLFITSGILQPSVLGNTQTGQVFLDGEITVFPNPTPNILTIQYNILQAGKMTAQVFDATGKRIITEEFIINSFSNKRYDLSRYSNGMYVLLLQYVGDDGTTIKKGQYKVMKL